MKATLITTVLAAAAAALVSFNTQAAELSSYVRESATPPLAGGTAKTREQVKAELAEAVARGEVNHGGVRPSFAYPFHQESAPGPLAASGGKTREQVKAELAEAIARGEVFYTSGNAYRRGYDSAAAPFIPPAAMVDAMARR